MSATREEKNMVQDYPGSTVLAGQTAWVLGGGSGLGAASAEALAAQGARVILSGRRAEALQRVAGRIAEAGGKAECQPLDVTDGEAITRVAAAIGAVDVLVYSSGTNVPRRALADLSGGDWSRIVDVNLSGALHCTQAVLPGMRERGRGTVVVISSWAGWRMEPVAGVSYSATKHALPALCETINIEEGRNGIRATCLMPAEAATDVLDTRPNPPSAEARAKMLQASDIGNTVAFVAAAPARMCVNQVVMSPLHNNFYARG
ncbi:SDR family oxidoreductase [Paracoccus litorisediminis]|uniref:SDR family oxidoreductase n=1 Tax=Paracoccus litorisediminis TaxID=2006130 RepID=UPI00372F3259